jgi:hypothetical protein
MKLFHAGLLLLPLLASAQTTTPAPEPPYNDGLFQPGVSDDSPSIDVDHKLKIYGKRIVAPRVLIGTLFTAGIKQWENSPGRWGRGWDGYGKRYGTDFARLGIRNTLAFGIDSTLHLDPRFHRAPDGESSASRFKHAVKQVLIVRKDSGGQSFAYGSVISAFAAGEAGTLWQPRRSDGRFGDGLVYAGFLIAGDTGRNVFREFWPDIRRKIRHK